MHERKEKKNSNKNHDNKNNNNKLPEEKEGHKDKTRLIITI